MALRDRIARFGAFLDNTRATRPTTGSPDVTKLPDDLIATRNAVVDLAGELDRLHALLTATVDPVVPPPTVAATFLNGASLVGVAGATDPAKAPFAVWRGIPIGIAGTWDDMADTNTQKNQWSTGAQYGGKYAAWAAPLDIAVGGIYPAEGESWAAAATDSTGAYATRWRNLGTLLRSRRPPATHGQTYIRFAHEWNMAGNYPWWVAPGQEDNFIRAWRVFYTAFKSTFPEAKIVWCPNRETSGNAARGIDCWPNVEYVDVCGVDYYAQFPGVASQAEWDAQYMAVDGKGAPKGIGAHLAFAQSKGKALAVPEWGVNSDFGDSAPYVTNMLNLMETKGGTGAGQIEYSIYFNAARADDAYSGKFGLNPYTESPLSAGAYLAWHQTRAGVPTTSPQPIEPVVEVTYPTTYNAATAAVTTTIYPPTYQEA